jgi:hypothetical protein
MGVIQVSLLAASLFSTARMQSGSENNARQRLANADRPAAADALGEGDLPTVGLYGNPKKDSWARH